jgi:hypothetical protein
VTHTIAAYRSAAPFMTRVASAAQRLCSNGVVGDYSCDVAVTSITCRTPDLEK